MRSLKLLGLVTAIASIFLGAIPALAGSITYNGSPLFRYKNTFYFFYYGGSPLTPGSEFLLTFPTSIPRNITRTSNICGVAKFSITGITKFKYQNQIYRTSNFPLLTVPKCVVGNPSTYLLQNVRDANYFYLANVPTQSPITITVDGAIVSRKIVNNCGYISWTAPSSMDIQQQEGFIGTRSEQFSADFGLFNFPVAPSAPRCLTIDGQQRLFVPVAPGFRP